jgi:hypothetical protein
MYQNDAEGAYRVLISELPFDLGPYVTPLVIADDAGAMKFMSQGGCQTYLQRVWKGNMVVETPNWRVSILLCSVSHLQRPAGFKLINYTNYWELNSYGELDLLILLMLLSVCSVSA